MSILRTKEWEFKYLSVKSVRGDEPRCYLRRRGSVSVLPIVIDQTGRLWDIRGITAMEEHLVMGLIDKSGIEWCLKWYNFGWKALRNGIFYTVVCRNAWQFVHPLPWSYQFIKMRLTDREAEMIRQVRYGDGSFYDVLQREVK